MQSFQDSLVKATAPYLQEDERRRLVLAVEMAYQSRASPREA